MNTVHSCEHGSPVSFAAGGGGSEGFSRPPGAARAKLPSPLRPRSRLQAQRELEIDVLRVLGAAVVGERFLDVAAAEVAAHPELELRGGDRVPARDEVEF